MYNAHDYAQPVHEYREPWFMLLLWDRVSTGLKRQNPYLVKEEDHTRGNIDDVHNTEQIEDVKKG
jgi:hypothetical protein